MLIDLTDEVTVQEIIKKKCYKAIITKNGKQERRNPSNLG